MRQRRQAARAVALLALGLGLGLGCSSSGSGPQTAAAEPAAEPAEDSAPRDPRVLSIPGAAAAERPATGGSGTTLAWQVPDGWEQQPPSSSMRLAQYRVPGPDGDAECVVYYFGPGQGGDPMANARRWAGQFTQPDGGSSLDHMTVTRLESAPLPTWVVEVRGTYDGGMTMTSEPAEPRPDSMLLGGIAEGPDAPWFFKLTGPAATVERQRDAFLSLMESLAVEN